MGFACAPQHVWTDAIKEFCVDAQMDVPAERPEGKGKTMGSSSSERREACDPERKEGLSDPMI